MTDSKKKRMSMLDSLAQPGGASPAPSMAVTNRALRSARDAVDGHRIWDLDPGQIVDDRTADRLNLMDVDDLRVSIEAVGQTVPILVRRDPANADRYLLVYGRRRLEAVRSSDQITKVRAMIATLDDRAAIRAQASENTARRDLSFIERALFAQELLDSEFGTQGQVAEVLNMTKSAISMALAVARSVGRDLAQAIGPAHGIGRPRWEALAARLGQPGIATAELIGIADRAHAAARPEAADSSVVAFEAVARHLRAAAAPPRPVPSQPRPQPRELFIDSYPAGKATRTEGGVRIDIRTEDPGFADWLQDQANPVLAELHARWKRRG